MPDAYSLSAGVSLGLLAGIVSGVCYLVANGVSWPKLESGRAKRCAGACVDEDVCRRCGGDARGGLVPCVCRYHRPERVTLDSGAWFCQQLERAVSLMPWSISTDKLEQIEEECESGENSLPSSGREARVRDFLETLAAQLAGGALDRTRVAKLYHHPSYLPPRDASPSSAGQHNPTSGASGAHAQLKRLVARVVEEAASLPALARYAAEPDSPPSIESSTYEDLLATAILNKVIERYQTENGSGGRSSGIHSASASPTPSERSSPRSLNTRHTRDISPPLPEEEDISDWEEGEATDDALELPKRVPFPEFGGDIVHNDNNDRDFDEVSGSDIQATDGSWEENWLFQKKKIKTLQSVPVPMLVPNSNAEYKAMIGDRDADDTTDLSDNASDPEEDQDDYKSDMKKVLDSKHVIGGKSKVDEVLDFEPDSLTMIDDAKEFDQFSDNERNHEFVTHAINNEINDNNITIEEKVNLDSGHDSIMVLDIDSGPLSKTEFSLKEEIHRTMLNRNNNEYQFEEIQPKVNGVVSEDVLDSFTSIKGSTNTLNRHEREGEYEETVTIPVQRYADSLRRKHFDDDPQQIPTRDTDKDVDDLIPGSIAYRERKKWLNYVDMPNNPYSPEAIKKRLLTKSTSSLFDMITSKGKDLDDEILNASDTTDSDKNISSDEIPVKDEIEQFDGINGSTFERTTENATKKSLSDISSIEVPPYKRYGRDYYIKEAKLSSGGRKKFSHSDTGSLSSLNISTSLDNIESELTAPGILIKQINTIAANQEYTKFAVQDQKPDTITTISVGNTNSILIEYDDDNENILFSAKPAYADDDTDKKFEELIHAARNSDLPLLNTNNKTFEEPERSPTNRSVDESYVSSSSMDDSIKIYNVQTGEILKCKPVDKISSRYQSGVDTNENIDMPDNSHLESSDEELSQNIEVLDDTVEAGDNFEEEKFEKNGEIDDILAQLPKVRELAKKFLSMENLNEPAKLSQPYSRRRRSKENILNGETERSTQKQMYMHSLTARSISKEFREELKLSMATPLKIPGGSKEVPDGTEDIVKESSRPGSPLPEPGTIKTKLAFFESLKSKLSGK